MFNLAILVSLFGILVSLFGALPIVTAWLFGKIARDDLESQKELLPIAVEVEKIQAERRACHPTPDREF